MPTPAIQAIIQGAPIRVEMKAPQGPGGKSAYQVAVENGFVGTEAQWLASLVGPNTVTSATTTNFTSGNVLFANSGFVGSLSRSGIDTRTSFPNDDVAAATSNSTAETIVKRDSDGAISLASSQYEGLTLSVVSSGDDSAEAIRGVANGTFGIAGKFISSSGTAIVAESINGTYHATFGVSGDNRSAVERVRGWFVWFYSTFTGRLKTANITANRDWTLPNASGTIALTSDIVDSVTSATTSNGTANLSISNVTTATATVSSLLTANHIHGNIAGTLYTHVRTGEAVAKGDPVYVSGFHNGTSQPIVSKADASNPAKMPAIGVMDADYLANVSSANCVIAGTITSVDTDAFSINSPVYVGNGGGFSETIGTIPQQVGIVERSNTNNGAFVVTNNKVVSFADVSDAQTGTAQLSLGDLEVVGGEIYTDGDYSQIYTQGTDAHIFTLGSGAEIFTEGELAQIYTTGASAQIYTAGAGATIGTQGANATIYTLGTNATISTAGSAAHIQTSHASAAVKSTNFAAVESGGASLVDGSMQPCLTWSAGGRNLTIPSGTATTFNTTSYTYGSGAAAAHRTALGLTTLATTTPAANVANFLEFPTSANLASALTDENGTGGGFVRAEGATLTGATLSGQTELTSSQTGATQYSAATRSMAEDSLIWASRVRLSANQVSGTTSFGGSTGGTVGQFSQLALSTTVNSLSRIALATNFLALSYSGSGVNFGIPWQIRIPFGSIMADTNSVFRVWTGSHVVNIGVPYNGADGIPMGMSSIGFEFRANPASPNQHQIRLIARDGRSQHSSGYSLNNGSPIISGLSTSAVNSIAAEIAAGRTVYAMSGTLSNVAPDSKGFSDGAVVISATGTTVTLDRNAVTTNANVQIRFVFAAEAGTFAASSWVDVGPIGGLNRQYDAVIENLGNGTANLYCVGWYSDVITPLQTRVPIATLSTGVATTGRYVTVGSQALEAHLITNGVNAPPSTTANSITIFNVVTKIGI